MKCQNCGRPIPCGHCGISQAVWVVEEEDKMTENFCSSIIQLDTHICSVTRTTDRLLENAQRCQCEDECTSMSKEPSQLRFSVRDLTERYQYELTSNSSFHQLTFSIGDEHLTVLVSNRHVDVVNLADRIAELAYRSKTMSAVTRGEQFSSEPDLRTAIPALRQAVVSQF
jgi:hypothetical protein